MKTTLIIIATVFAVAAAYSPEIKKIPNGKNGSGTTTYNWDCCKPTCSSKENINTPDMIPIASCAADGVTTLDPSVKSACYGGTSYMCNNQQPFIVNETMGYGFASVSFPEGTDTNLCCSCYLINFLQPIAIQDKQLILQISQTGRNQPITQFEIALPGGCPGLNIGCHYQWNAPWDGWGDDYDGIHVREECLSLLPEELHSGCLFRFDFLHNPLDPKIEYKQVECPQELVAISGCNLSP